MLDEREKEAGYFDVMLDGKGLASGVNLYWTRVGEFMQTENQMLMK